MVSYSQHMIDTSLPYEDGGKITKAVENIFRTWKETASFTAKDGTVQKNGTQLVFCDRGVPGGSDAARGAGIYEDMRNLLVGMGIPADQISFIHEADTDEKKILFSRKSTTATCAF